MSTESTSLRLDKKAKKQAYAVFKEVGLKPAQAFNLFLRQVVIRGGLPFDVRIPNPETIEAIRELESGKGVTVKDNQSFYEELDI